MSERWRIVEVVPHQSDLTGNKRDRMMVVSLRESSKFIPVLGLCVVMGLSGCAQGTSAGPPAQGEAFATAEASKTQLIGAGIATTISGKRYAWFRARDHATGETQFNADGVMIWKRTDTVSDGRGKWTVEGDMLCQAYDPTPKWKGGRVCRKLYVDGAKLMTSPNDGGLVSYTEVPAA